MEAMNKRPVIAKRAETSLPDRGKIKVNFDVPLLNVLIKYVTTPNLSMNRITVLYNFLDEVNIEKYAYDPAIYDRLRIIKSIAEIITKDKIRDPELIASTVLERNLVPFDVYYKLMPKKEKELTGPELDKLSRAISERFQYIIVSKYTPRMTDILDSIDKATFDVSYTDLVMELKHVMTELISEMQSSECQEGLLRKFSFDSDDFEELMELVLTKAKKPASILQTGIRYLNASLSPGFQSGRMYTILGGSGKFKSGTLLNIADQIRRFNPQIVPYENGRRKCILFITMENSIEETVERIYDMYSDMNDDMRDKSIEEVIETLREYGEFTYTSDKGIDIEFRYYGNLEIDTGYINTIIADLRDNAKEPICIILDYIKRIDAVHRYRDERERLAHVSKELKNLAQYYEIPVITAMQLNREGNNILDTAVRDERADIARFVGSSNVGNAWDIIEDSDWVALINVEVQKSTEQTYLTWKRLKIRKKKAVGLVNGVRDVEYFNHPFTNEKCIRLETDVDKPEPVSIASLVNDLETLEEQAEREAQPRTRPSIQLLYDNSAARTRNVVENLKLNNVKTIEEIRTLAG